MYYLSLTFAVKSLKNRLKLVYLAIIAQLANYVYTYNCNISEYCSLSAFLCVLFLKIQEKVYCYTYKEIYRPMNVKGTNG